MADKEFGAYLKSLLEKINMSQATFARKSNISEPTISRIISGIIKQPSHQTLRKMAPVLNVPYEELLQKAGYIKHKIKGELEEEYLYIPPEELEGLNYEEREEVKQAALEEARRIAEIIKRHKRK